MDDVTVTPDRVYLGRHRRRALQACVAVAVVLVLHIITVDRLTSPWNWLLIVGDLVALGLLLRSAARWPTYLEVTDRELSARLGFVRRFRWATSSVTAIERGDGRVVFPASRRRPATVVAMPFVTIDGPGGRVLLRMEEQSHADRLCEALTSRTGVATSRLPLADDVPTADSVLSKGRRLTTGAPVAPSIAVVAYAFVAMFAAVSLVADRTPDGELVSADAVLADIEAASRRLPAPVAEPTGFEVEVTRCGAQMPFISSDPDAWEIDISTWRSVDPAFATVDWWRDNVNELLGSDGFVAERDGFRIGMPTFSDRLHLDIGTECVVTDANGRDGVAAALTELSARLLAVTLRARALDEVAMTLGDDAERIPSAVLASVRSSATVTTEPCDGIEGATRTTAVTSRDLEPFFPMRAYLDLVAEWFDKDPLVMQFSPGVFGNGYSADIVRLDDTLTVTVTTDCGIGTALVEDVESAAADLAARLVDVDPLG
jgi:hypothetical protein